MSNDISDADVAHRDAICYLFVKNTKMNGCRSKLINFSFHNLINLDEAKKYKKKKHMFTCTCTDQQPISHLPCLVKEAASRSASVKRRRLIQLDLKILQTS